MCAAIHCRSSSVMGSASGAETRVPARGTASRAGITFTTPLYKSLFFSVFLWFNWGSLSCPLGATGLASNVSEGNWVTPWSEDNPVWLWPEVSASGAQSRVRHSPVGQFGRCPRSMAYSVA
jgi:hypothetical protein